jgi:hypothetical protein
VVKVTSDIRRRIGRVAGRCLAAAVLCGGASAAQAADFAAIVAAHAQSDHDGDGKDEIESLVPLFPEELAKPTPAGVRLVVVLVEERLFDAVPGSPYGPQDLVSALNRHRDDLRAQGFVSRTLRARVYGGLSHQDGRTVLALRELLKATRASYPQLQGAMLVGDFPEAMIVRSVPRKLGEDRLLIRPEVIARRSDLVLADLDGRWHQLYQKARTTLPGISALGVQALPGNPGDWPCKGCRVRSANHQPADLTVEDFFYAQDDIYFTSESNGGLEITIAEMRAGLELAPSDFASPNPIAQPEIVVSRINPHHVAIEPNPGFTDSEGRGYLDASGRPQTVRKGSDVYWTFSADIERRMLIAYFDRNHDHRAGRASTLRTSALSFPESQFPVASVRNFLQEAASGFGAPLSRANASVLDLVTFLKQPAVLKGVHVHANRDGQALDDGYDVEALEQAVGPHVWRWERQGEFLVPGFEGLPEVGVAGLEGETAHYVGDDLFYSLWRNQALGSRGVFYIHNGCDVISPQGAEDDRYDLNGYGARQNGEGWLFYLNGLALLGRAKDFNDIPWGATAELKESPERPFGSGWQRQFDVSSADTVLAANEIQRKRSYSWGLLGDWTLTLHPPMVETKVSAFAGTDYRGSVQRLGMGTHEVDDFAWSPEAIDSLVMGPAVETRLFHADNGVGRYATVRGDLPSVATFGYADYIRSMQVRPRQGGYARLHANVGYGGASAVIPPGHYTFTQIRDTFGIAPKSVSSLQLDGVDVFVYDRQTWWNQWRVFGGSVPDLGAHGWNDRLESVVVVPRGLYATAYQHQGYAGGHVVLEPGRYDDADLPGLGLDGWAISSLYVGSGVRVIAYRQPGFQGTPLVLNASVGDLIPLGWNDAIRSIVVEAE